MQDLNINDNNKDGIDTILVEYYKIPQGETESYLMVLNRKEAYLLGNDGLWRKRPGLFRYIFRNSDYDGIIPEAITPDRAIFESSNRKRLTKNKIRH